MPHCLLEIKCGDPSNECHLKSVLFEKYYISGCLLWPNIKRSVALLFVVWMHWDGSATSQRFVSVGQLPVIGWFELDAV
jgi:hypothetical protein